MRVCVCVCVCVCVHVCTIHEQNLLYVAELNEGGSELHLIAVHYAHTGTSGDDTECLHLLYISAVCAERARRLTTVH